MAVKRAVGCRNVYIAEKTGVKTYSTPIRVIGLESFQYQLKYASFTAFSDDVMDSNMDFLQSADLTIQVRELSNELNAKIAGHEGENGRLTINVKDVQPQFAVLMEETKLDGTSTYRVFYDVTLKREGQTNATKGESINPDSVTLNGVAKPDEQGNVMHSIESDATDLDASLVEKFFTEVVQPEMTKIPNVAG